MLTVMIGTFIFIFGVLVIDGYLCSRVYSMYCMVFHCTVLY